MLPASADTPAAANNLVRMIRMLLRFAIDENWRKDDPTLGTCAAAGLPKRWPAALRPMQVVQNSSWIKGSVRRARPLFALRLTAAAADAWRLVGIQRRHRVRRVLQIGPQVGRGSAREAPDVRIFDDRLVELDERLEIDFSRLEK